MERQITEQTSWTFLGAMHGFDQPLWTDFGYLKSGQRLPSAKVQKRMWQQCQHQSWYFLPWHRGYLAAFEAIVHDAVVKLGGPADWTLPYWNYSDTSDPNALKLPAAFNEMKVPTGEPNPLFVTRRYGDGSGTVVIYPRLVALTKVLKETEFAGTSTGGSSGFGGPPTRFQHSSENSNANGQLEQQPHNNVHVLVGGQIAHSNGQDPRNLGLMTNPDTAALDPIFWLHHANIDRLWEVWLKRNVHHQNPTKLTWLTGPANRKFAMPKPDGSDYHFAAKDVLDATALGYTYEDVSDPLHGENRIAGRLQRLGVRAAGLSALPGGSSMATKKTELLGANREAIALGGGTVETRVQIDKKVGRKLRASFQSSARAAAPTEPDRIFLNLENIRGANDATIFYVYVDLPKGAKPEDHPECLAGSVSLFGVRKASRLDDRHAGNGINETLEITDIVDSLHLQNKLDTDHLNVQFVPHTEIKPTDRISIGKVSLYRQGR